MHTATHCDVIDCPECRQGDDRSRCEQSWLGWSTWLSAVVKPVSDWTLVDVVVGDDRRWQSDVSLQLTLDLPDEQPGMMCGEVARRLRALADAIDREVYRREGFQAALKRAS